MTDYTWIRITNDQKVSNSPCVCGAVILSSDAGGNADVSLYDGVSTDDPKILTVRAAQYTTKVVTFQPFLTTKRGLYVDVGSNVGELLVQLAIEHE